jgi:hypothetical protein
VGDEVGEQAAAAALQLGWVAQLPALKRVVLRHHLNQEFAAAVRQAMRGLLALKPWVQVL